MTGFERGRQYWEKHARGYDLSLRLLARPLPRMLALTKDAVQGCSRVLEVAAGTGLVTRAVAGAVGTVIATDYAEAMVALLERSVREAGLVNVTCEVADLYALRFEEAEFDAVIAANVLHLVPELERAIVSLRRMLKPGGRLIAPTFCHDETMLSRLVSRALSITGFPNQRRFTSKSLREALEGAGLSVTRSEMLPGVIPIGYVEGRFND